MISETWGLYRVERDGARRLVLVGDDRALVDHVARRLAEEMRIDVEVDLMEIPHAQG